MKKISKKIISIIIFLLVSINVFANTYENPNVFLGPNSAEANEIKIDDKNYALSEIMKIMTKEDCYQAIVLVSEYRKGYKEAEPSLIELLSKYVNGNAGTIAAYILRDSQTQLFAGYIVDHDTNTVQYVQIEGLLPPESQDAINIGNEMWKKIMNEVPEEFYKNINFFYLEGNKPEDSLITICDYDEEARSWCMYIDISLLLDENIDKLKQFAIYSTVYYYILRTDQVDFENTNSSLYSYRNHYYKEDSYINLFYKKYWKGKFNEINLDQYNIYKKEFLNSKASKTVYDDMAVTFEDYIKNGVNNKNITKPKEIKRNFFDDFTLFKELAVFFRKKNIEMLK